jgi:hypothetical protein
MVPSTVWYSSTTPKLSVLRGPFWVWLCPDLADEGGRPGLELSPNASSRLIGDREEP